MLQVFESVKPLFKLDTICIDNNVFRLHYKATFISLLIASLLVTAKQYIGDPIDCMGHKEDVQKVSLSNQVRNSYLISYHKYITYFRSLIHIAGYIQLSQWILQELKWEKIKHILELEKCQTTLTTKYITNITNGFALCYSSKPFCFKYLGMFWSKNR